MIAHVPKFRALINSLPPTTSRANHQFLEGGNLATLRSVTISTKPIPPKWVAFVPRLSRSPPRSSLSGTTPVSLSTSRPTSASAMRSPSLLPSASATRSAAAADSRPFYSIFEKKKREEWKGKTTMANTETNRLPATPPT